MLQENQEPYLVPSRIYDRVARLVANNAEQKPMSEPLKGVGDHGGQFVFRLTDVTVSPPSVTTPTAVFVPSVPKESGESEKQMKEMRQWSEILDLLENLK